MNIENIGNLPFNYKVVTDVESELKNISSDVKNGIALEMSDFVDILSSNMSKVAEMTLTQDDVRSMTEEMKAATHSTESNKIKRVICWGDSLTDTSTYSRNKTSWVTDYFAPKMRQTNDISVINCGIGGIDTARMALFQGALTINKTPTTLSVGTTIWSDGFETFGSTKSISFGGITNNNCKFNPVRIGEAHGTLTIANNQYNFIRNSEETEPYVMTISEPVVSENEDMVNKITDVNVIYGGANDAEYDECITYTKMIADNTKSGKYIVIGITSAGGKETTPQNRGSRSVLGPTVYKQALAFGNHYINLLEYLIQNGITDFKTLGGSFETYGCTEAECLEDKANGKIPRCMYEGATTQEDYTHLNDYSRQIIANLVYNKGKELKYWN